MLLKYPANSIYFEAKKEALQVQGEMSISRRRRVRKSRVLRTINTISSYHEEEIDDER